MTEIRWKAHHTMVHERPGLYKKHGSNPAFTDAMILEIRSLLPEAYLVRSPYPPVAGALLLGLDRMNSGPSQTVYGHLNDYFL